MASKMWHNRPASEYIEGYPVGNGVLAAMVLGRYPKERIALNHEWLWRAEGRYRDFQPCHQHLDEIRGLFLEGKTLQAGELANEKLGSPPGNLFSRVPYGIPNSVDPYQPAGDLFLDTGIEDVSQYRRLLDLATGIAETQYVSDNVEFGQQCFAHASRKIICVRLFASKLGALNVKAELSRTEDTDCKLSFHSDNKCLRMKGKFVEGSEFCVMANIYSKGGQVSGAINKESICIAKADEVVILLTISVAHNGEDVEALAVQQFLNVPTDWKTLVNEHTKTFSSVYNRVSLDLGQADDSKPTDECIKIPKRRDANNLIELYFNFGRYLFISSNLRGELPANLQGKWNEELKPAWECDYHHDINLQMNYWPGEVCNMADFIEPLFAHIERLVPHSREMAKAIYNCGGVLFPIVTDPWSRATPESRGWNVWTGAAAWFAQHMWWHYEWGCDLDFLRRRAYPFFKEVADFYEDFLVRNRRGQLVTVPSQSPENRFVGGSEPVSLCVGATMDFELIYDVLSHAIKASEILDLDAERRAKWKTILEEIPPLQVGKNSQLQEWLEDYEEVNPHHVHISHDPVQRAVNSPVFPRENNFQDSRNR